MYWTDLAHELAKEYDLDPERAKESVDNELRTLLDNPAMWDPEEQELSDAGADWIRDRFKDGYDESPNLLDIAAAAPLPEVTAGERAAWDGARESRRGKIRALRPLIEQARRALEELEKERDEHVRAAVMLGVKPSTLAEDAGVQRSRIYQIRDAGRPVSVAS